MMNGRGRGVSNAPAWMTEQQRSNPGGNFSGGLPPSVDGGFVDQPMNNAPRSNFGGLSYNAGPAGRPPGNGGGSGSMYRRGMGKINEDYRDYRGGGRASNRPTRSGRVRPQEEFFPIFYSWEEERDWVEDRLRKKRARATLFDQPPSEEQQRQMEALKLLEEMSKASSGLATPAPQQQQLAAVIPQQTRHARRLYVGNLPEDVNEAEIQDFFLTCITIASGSSTPLPGDPILSVYINRERRFAFVEFKTMEMTTACMALDGININGKGIIKVKRPNDYNPSLAPPQASAGIPDFDVSKLGIVAGTVPDGPNKIFIGGLPYHLTDAQVMELLGAFGPIRAFHLVKSDPAATQSKGYCFVEYSNPEVTTIAVTGLNGMELGEGKVLSARVAASRGGVGKAGEANYIAQLEAEAEMASYQKLQQPQPQYNTSSAYNAPAPAIQSEVDALLNAALAGAMPTSQQPMMAVQQQQPNPGALADIAAAYLSQVFPSAPMPVAVTPGSIMTQVAATNAADIASAALNAAFGGAGVQSQPYVPLKTRILVLLNMVTDQDLATNQDYNDLREEVREECEKYGKLLSIKIPRVQDGFPENSTAIRKIYLEYATVQDANSAENELAGRSFGNNVVQVTYFDEQQYLSGNLW